jgi:hypothetical protein
MKAETKIGVFLIILGICIPLAALPFVSGYSREKGILGNFHSMGIQLRKDAGPKAGQEPKSLDKPHRKTLVFSMAIPRRIPFRLFFIPTTILIYIGVIRIERARRADERDDGAADEP